MPDKDKVFEVQNLCTPSSVPEGTYLITAFDEVEVLGRDPVKGTMRVKIKSKDREVVVPQVFVFAIGDIIETYGVN